MPIRPGGPQCGLLEELEWTLEDHSPGHSFQMDPELKGPGEDQPRSKFRSGFSLHQASELRILE